MGEAKAVESVREAPGLQLVSGYSVFTHYFYMDAMSVQVPNITGADGQPLPQNPLRDLRVRRAISMAINAVGNAHWRPSLAARVPGRSSTCCSSARTWC